MQNQNEAFLYGLLLMSLAMAAFVLWFETNDYTPTRRRAVRVALPTGAACAVGVGFSEWALYKADPIAGAFMLMPSAALAILAFIFGGLWAYRLAGGGRYADPKPEQEAGAHHD